MNIFIIILIILYILSLIMYYISNFFLKRNKEVCKEKKRILNQIYNISLNDLSSKWRIKEFEKIKYDDMLYKFWIPVKAFYKDHPCLKQYKEIEN